MRKKRIYQTKTALYLGMGGVLFVFLFCYLAAFSAKTKKFTVDKTFYFLAEEASESVAVFAQSVYNSGGAGYTFEEDGKTYSVLAAYNALSDAQTVADTMALRGRETSILPVFVGTFYFTTGALAAKAEETKGVVYTVLECIDVLYSAANKLETGEYTQEEGRVSVEGIGVALKGLETNGASSVSLLRAGQEKCTEITEGTVYAKDLRYLQIELIEGIISLRKIYSV